MNLRRIRFFLLLADTLNFSETARRCGISQPALTKSIKKLEEETGGLLIRREGVHSHLTHFGQMMLEQFQKVDAAARSAEGISRSFARNNSQQLHLGVMCTIGPKIIAPFLADFQAMNPQTEVILRDANRAEMLPNLLNGTFDCALVSEDLVEKKQLRLELLYQEKMVLACSVKHPFAQKETVTLTDVMAEPYLDRLNCEFRDSFLKAVEEQQYNVMFAARSEREDWIQSLLAKNTGVSIQAQSSILHPDVIGVPLQDEAMQRNIYLAVAPGRADTALMRNFLAAVRRNKWVMNADT